jgi:hypothetical protein
MSLNVIKSLICGLLVSQISTVSIAAPQNAASLADSEIAQCEAVKPKGATAHTSCIVSANTKLIERRLTAEKNILAIFAACSDQFTKVKNGKAFASWCQQEGEKRAKSVNQDAMLTSLAYQEKLLAFVTEQTFMSQQTRDGIVAKQTAAIQANSTKALNSEEQLNFVSTSVKKSYKTLTKKNFVY